MPDIQEEENVDYLHPDGKPADSEKKTEDEYAIKRKSRQTSIDEADGHHMCSAECQKHHLV